jgi:hypothetical protein
MSLGGIAERGSAINCGAKISSVESKSEVEIGFSIGGILFSPNLGVRNDKLRQILSDNHRSRRGEGGD